MRRASGHHGPRHQVVDLLRPESGAGQHDAALALLDVAKAGGFAPLFHEIRGDLYAAKGDAPAARKEYDAALAASATPGEGPALDTQYVELKRDALAGAATVAAAEPQPAAAPAPAPATGTQP